MEGRISEDGRVTIPRLLRDRYRLLPKVAVEFIEGDGWLGIRPIGSTQSDSIGNFLERLAGSGSGELTTDELMELSRGCSEDG